MVRLDLMMENDEKWHQFLLVFYDFEKLASYHLSMNQNFLLFSDKCRVDRFKSIFFGDSQGRKLHQIILPPSSLTRNTVYLTGSSSQKLSWFRFKLFNLNRDRDRLQKYWANIEKRWHSWHLQYDRLYNINSTVLLIKFVVVCWFVVSSNYSGYCCLFSGIHRYSISAK